VEPDKKRLRLRRAVRLALGIGLGALLAELCGYLPPEVALPCRIVGRVVALVAGGL
jgi:hypothetical protein